MNTFNELITDFYLKQREYSYLKGINLNRSLDKDDKSYNLTMILCSYSHYEGKEKLVLNFSGVREFKIGNLDNLFRIELNINDISSNQMENIRYRVVEDENSLFSFYCSEFKFGIL